MSGVRIKDVAKLSGVSTATVSHVLNKTRYVSDADVAVALRCTMRPVGFIYFVLESFLETSRSH